MATVAHPERLSDHERRVVEAVGLDEPWALVERFAELERVSGTEDERRAAAYLVDRLERHGIDARRYDPSLYISQPHDAAVSVIGHDLGVGPVKTVAFSAADSVGGPLRYVGGVGSALDGGDDHPLGPYRDVEDLTGEVALTAAGSLSIRATQVLADKGAVGVVAIHQHDREPHDGIATPVWGGAPPHGEEDRIPSVPVVNVTKPDGEALRGLADSDDPVEVELETDLTTGWFECPVVEARIEGRGDSDEFVLLHGHYDSWGVGVTDNATGDAGLLELARVFHELSDDLKRDLRVAWWPAHSTGRYAGSTWYADEFALDLVERCVAQINMDSPGAKDATEYTDMSCWAPEAHGLVGGAIEDVADAPYEEHHPHRAGDYSFDNLGLTGFFMLSSNIPADVREERGYHPVGGCGGNSDAWHLSTDTLDKAGKDELLRDIRVYAVAVDRVLNAAVLPFDHRHTVERLREAVSRYDEAAGDAFDLGPTLDALDDLGASLAELYRSIDDGAIDADGANAAIRMLSRTLTRLNLVERGPFEQDPATGRDPVPSLAHARKFPHLEGDDRRFLETRLTRAQNDAVYRLRQLDRHVTGILGD